MSPPDDLPQVLGMFPIEGALLLPHMRLPLIVFEPRYLALVNDCLSGSRLLGMLQPRGREHELYSVGCAGRIVRYEEVDEHLFVVLKGISRFRLGEEHSLGEGGYRRFAIEAREFQTDRLPLPSESFLPRQRMEAALQKSVRSVLPADVDLSVVLDSSDAEVVNLLSVLYPFAASEKQALLEQDSVQARGKSLLALLEIEAESSHFSQSPS